MHSANTLHRLMNEVFTKQATMATRCLHHKIFLYILFAKRQITCTLNTPINTFQIAKKNPNELTPINLLLKCVCLKCLILIN